VFPKIDRPVADITAADVLNILKPIWYEKAETAIFSRTSERSRANRSPLTAAGRSALPPFTQGKPGFLLVIAIPYSGRPLRLTIWAVSE
jgi:hypothetical protein